MAITYGTSGSWKIIIFWLNGLELHAANPDALRALIPELEAMYEAARQNGEEAFASHLAALETKWHLAASTASHLSEKLRSEYEGRIKQINQAFLPNDAGSIFLRVESWLNRKIYQRNLRQLHTWFQEQTAQFQRQVESAETTVRDFQSSRQTFVNNHSGKARNQWGVVRAILQSPYLAGAVGELEIQNCLQRLPDSYHVLADVRFTYKEYVFYKGENLRTAQLDYVVVGPSGLFVIEAKLWSEDFSQAGNYHNPYRQVDRAQFLCYLVLKDAGLETKCRSIIATRGVLPEKPESSFAKVLRPDQLFGYVQYYGEVQDPSRVHSVVRVLREIGKVD